MEKGRRIKYGKRYKIWKSVTSVYSCSEHYLIVFLSVYRTLKSVITIVSIKAILTGIRWVIIIVRRRKNQKKIFFSSLL